MKKNLLIAAIAITALASCSSNDFVGDESPQGSIGTNGAISFNMETPAITRTGGSTAATALSNRFIVWGEKNEANGNAASEANLVFKNYKVEWVDNSAYTSTSNTKSWEYVGLTPYTNAQVSPAISGAQTIKYWDYSASSYTFTAVSALDADITDGKVVISKTQSGNDVYAKGYEIAVKSGANIGNIYIADRNNITKTSGTDRNATNAYGGNVTMTFRNFMSKIRFGIYENIPGYKVKITNVDYNNTSHSSGDGGTGKFGVDGKFLVAGDNTAYTVSYETSNKAKMAVKGATTPNSETYLETAQTIAGCPILSSTEISTSPATPTWDQTGGTYTNILPFPSNNVNMKVKLDFTLYSLDTNEEINVVDATAEIPAIYCQWKPNYAYTYILKLNDNTNGQIGGVTGLYPITFDAVEVTDENGVAEYITTVSEPSITTYAKGSAVTVNGEYKAGESIYAVVEDGSSLATLSASNMKLYTVTTTDDSNFPITEASVAEAIAEYPIMTTAEQTDAKIKFTASSFNYGKTIVAEDGSTVEMDATNNVVASFTGAAITSPSAAPQYYAIEYVKTPANYGNDGGKTYADATAFNAAGTLYKEAACTNVADVTYYNEHSGETYYKKTHVIAVGTYAYKIVKVVP